MFDDKETALTLDQLSENVKGGIIWLIRLPKLQCVVLAYMIIKHLRG